MGICSAVSLLRLEVQRAGARRVIQSYGLPRKLRLNMKLTEEEQSVNAKHSDRRLL